MKIWLSGKTRFAKRVEILRHYSWFAIVGEIISDGQTIGEWEQLQDSTVQRRNVKGVTNKILIDLFRNSEARTFGNR